MLTAKVLFLTEMGMLVTIRSLLVIEGTVSAPLFVRSMRVKSGVFFCKIVVRLIFVRSLFVRSMFVRSDFVRLMFVRLI